jgi:predicted nuclease with TOPRIM domain
MAEVTKEELSEITSLREKLSTVVSESGQLSLQIQLLETDVAELKSKLQEQGNLFKSLLEEEQQLINRLSEKYGTGSINFETGEFTPER